MQNSKFTFEIEIENLLREYLGEDCINSFDQYKNDSKKADDEVSEKINSFYKEQLQINTGNYSERIKVDRTITLSEKKLEPDIFCKFLLQVGQVCLSGGKLDLATEIYKKAYSQADKPFFKAESLTGLADIYSRRANWSRCTTMINQAKSLYEKINSGIGLAKCENILGSVFGERGDIDTARQHFLNSLSFITPEADPEMAANLEINLGALDGIRGKLKDALMHLNRALQIYSELGNYKRVSEINLNIGLVYFEAGEYELAIAAFDDGIDTAKEGGFISVLCLIYLAKSKALILMNDVYHAALFADKAFEISHNIDDKLTLADLYKIKGIIERHLKNFKTAESFLLNSLRINTYLNNGINIAETSFELAMLYEELGNHKSQHFYLMSSLNYYKKINAFTKVKKIEELLEAINNQSELPGIN